MGTALPPSLTLTLMSPRRHVTMGAVVSALAVRIVMMGLPLPGVTVVGALALVVMSMTMIMRVVLPHGVSAGVDGALAVVMMRTIISLG